MKLLQNLKIKSDPPSEEHESSLVTEIAGRRVASSAVE